MAADNGEVPDRQTVADPEEFNQQRRLASIHDARDRARVAYEKIRDPATDGRYREHAQMYRATVENYIGEIEALAIKYQFGDNETDFWNLAELGQIVLPLPAELKQLYQDDSVRVLDDDIERETETITGLEGYLSAPASFQAEYEVMVQEHGKRPKPRRANVSMGMPVDISYQAFRNANKFLALAGIDIELDSGGQPTIKGFDQSGDASNAELVMSGSGGDVPL